MKLGEPLMKRNLGVLNMNIRYLLDNTGQNIKPADFLLVRGLRRRVVMYNFRATQREIWN